MLRKIVTFFNLFGWRQHQPIDSNFDHDQPIVVPEGWLIPTPGTSGGPSKKQKQRQAPKKSKVDTLKVLRRTRRARGQNTRTGCAA